MIFGHCLEFKDEPILDKEFKSFSFNSIQCKNDINIQIIESCDYSKSYNFPYKTDWDYMSGQQTRYHAVIPFDKTGKINTWALEIRDVLTLIWDAEDRKIIYEKAEKYTVKQLQFWIYHTFFPIVLEMEDIYHILHVGSVEIEGKPVIFSAFSFGGKSTLTDYFIQKGHVMLSDDSIAIDKRDDNYYAIPSYPFHRPYREFETLGYPVANFATESKPLHAVYLLEKSEPDAKVQIMEVKGIEKFKAFHYSTFIDFSCMKQKRFLFFTEMAKQIPVYSIVVPWDLKRLNEVYTEIIKHSSR